MITWACVPIACNSLRLSASTITQVWVIYSFEILAYYTALYMGGFEVVHIAFFRFIRRTLAFDGINNGSRM
jgi:hypothetical protein